MTFTKINDTINETIFNVTNVIYGSLYNHTEKSHGEKRCTIYFTWLNMSHIANALTFVTNAIIRITNHLATINLTNE